MGCMRTKFYSATTTSSEAGEQSNPCNFFCKLFKTISVKNSTQMRDQW